MADACGRCGCACGACQGLCTLYLCECEDGDGDEQDGYARFFCDSIPTAQGQGVQVLRGVVDAKFHEDIPMVGSKINAGSGVAAQRGGAGFHEGIPSVTARGFGAKGVSANLGGQGAQAAEIKFHEGRPHVMTRLLGGSGVTTQREWYGDEGE